MTANVSSTPPALAYDIFAHHGRHLIQAYDDQRAPFVIPASPPTEPSPPRLPPPPPPIPLPVGILGAGIGGLYAALILQKLGIPYRILEARHRVGGRLFTYTFPDETGHPYNYFDAGAMRFPDIPAMGRVFHLFNMPELNTPDIELKNKLKPFYYNGHGTQSAFLSFNDVVVRKNAVPADDPFKSAEVLKVPDAHLYIDAGVQDIINDVVDPFARGILQDLRTGGKEGWSHMMKFDHHSIRSYMATEYIPSDALNIPRKHLPSDVVNWCETFTGNAGWFDRALSELILGMVAFGWQPGPADTKWYLIDGGASEIARGIWIHLTRHNPAAVEFGAKVTSIAWNRAERVVDVETNHNEHHRFSHVITTLPLPVLRTIDLKNAKLTPLQYSALRQLNYSPSVKIGMQFKTAWWTTANDESGQRLGIVGGQSTTDTPLRNVVYPSFGDAIGGKTPTLIASYCSLDDAIRMSAMMDEDSKTALTNLVLRQLAKIHNVKEAFLHEQLIDVKPWSWHSDPYTMGGFATFGPGKFESLYTSLTTPASGGRLHFAGEAISPRHAWVAGSLHSVWRAVREMLLFPPFRGLEADFFELFGRDPEWVRDPRPSGAGEEANVQPLNAALGTGAAQAVPITEDLVLEHLAATIPELDLS